jgi:hypothetical protein
MKLGGIISVSRIFDRGGDKMRSQATARFNGASGSHSVAQQTSIYSDSTYTTYRAVWQQYADHLKSELGIKHIEQGNAGHVRHYLEQRIEDGISLRTWNKEASAMGKLAVALDRTSTKLGWNREYDFSRDIDSVRVSASHELHKSDESRAYQSPEQLVVSLKSETHSIAAKLQFEGGARIREISNLKSEQFKGYKQDAVTGERVGIVHINNGKGGYERDMYVSVKTYDKALAQTEQQGQFSFDHNQYRQELKTGATAIGERYSGSHGLRWNYAQQTMKDFQRSGMRYEQALLETSARMGHHRSSITEHYLK